MPYAETPAVRYYKYGMQGPAPGGSREFEPVGQEVSLLEPRCGGGGVPIIWGTGREVENSRGKCRLHLRSDDLACRLLQSSSCAVWSLERSWGRGDCRLLPLSMPLLVPFIVTAHPVPKEMSSAEFG